MALKKYLKTILTLHPRFVMNGCSLIFRPGPAGFGIALPVRLLGKGILKRRSISV
jgi:hypothetical protein